MSRPGPEALEACRGLVIDFYRSIDRKTATAALPLLTPDIRLHTPGGLITAETIQEFLAAREDPTTPATRHVIAHDRFSVTGADTITQEAMLLVYFAQPEGYLRLERALDVQHHFRRMPTGWHIAGRTLEP